MRKFLVVVMVLAALTATPWVASAVTTQVTVVDSLGNKYPLPVTMTVTATTDGVADSVVVFAGKFPTGQGEITITVVADFDSSGQVGFDDLFLFAAAFDSKKGAVGYEPRFDLDKDGEIGFFDFFVFANHFNKGLADTRSTVRVESPDGVFTARDTSFVGSPAKPLTLKVQVKNLRRVLTASIVGDTANVFVGDTWVIRGVTVQTLYGARHVQIDTLSVFSLTADRGLRTMGGNAVVADSAGTFNLNVQSGSLITTFTVRVQPLRQALIVDFLLGRQTIAYGDTTVLVGLIKTYRADTMLVSEVDVPLGSLKITIPLRTSGHLIIGDKIGTFQGAAQYNGLTASFELTVNPPRRQLVAVPSAVTATVGDTVKVSATIYSYRGADTTVVRREPVTPANITLKSDLGAGVGNALVTKIVGTGAVLVGVVGDSLSASFTLIVKALPPPPRPADQTPPKISVGQGNIQANRDEVRLDLSGAFHDESGVTDQGQIVVTDIARGTKVTTTFAINARYGIFEFKNLKIAGRNDGKAARTLKVEIVAKDIFGNVATKEVTRVQQPGEPPPPPPPQEPPPPPPPPANVASSFTAATASRGGQSFLSGSAFSATVGQSIIFSWSVSGNPQPSVALTVSVANGPFQPANNPFVPQQSHGSKVLRFMATASNGVGSDAVATWTVTVQGGAP